MEELKNIRLAFGYRQHHVPRNLLQLVFRYYQVCIQLIYLDSILRNRLPPGHWQVGNKDSQYLY
jgi:hypothetical protein